MCSEEFVSTECVFSPSVTGVCLMVDACFVCVMFFGHSVSDSIHTTFKLMTSICDMAVSVQYSTIDMSRPARAHVLGLC